jgi:hypothetical protein
MSETHIRHTDRQPRHILALSGGKDSTALAIYMKDKVPEMEYVFCDTEKELRETYDYLDKLEVYLGKPIVRLKHEGMGFDDLLKIRNGFLPSPQARWCTEYLKIKPYEKYVADDPVTSYIGIRADESNRKGYISTKPNIVARFPFVEGGLVRSDIVRILEDSGLGMPKYYEWRSRSGCYFCFFQQRREWVGLLERHPDLYRLAMGYEKEDPQTGQRYTWVQGESLEELTRPGRIDQIKRDFETRMGRRRNHRDCQSLVDVFSGGAMEERSGCLICHL